MFLPVSNKNSGFSRMILLLAIIGAAVVSVCPVSADTGITIAARGDQSYYQGEEVVLSGNNYESDFTYLFIFGPGISDKGGRLTSPYQEVVSGNPDSFDRVAIKPDKSWEYIFYSGNLGLNPGTYTIYAVSQPETKDQVDRAKFSTTTIILKKPFVSAGISPSSVPKGQPFTVTGLAEGDPSVVHIWIIGDNYLYDTSASPGPNSTYTFNAATEISGNLPKGQCYLIVQHPMQNNQLDIVRDGDWVKNRQLNEGSSTGGTNIFRITGAGSLQGGDTVRALVAAFDDSNVDDTYTVIRFTVDDTGISAPQAQTTMTAPIQPQPRTAPLQYAPVGAFVLIIGIIVWCRR